MFIEITEYKSKTSQGKVILNADAVDVVFPFNSRALIYFKGNYKAALEVAETYEQVRSMLGIGMACLPRDVP